MKPLGLRILRDVTVAIGVVASALFATSAAFASSRFPYATTVHCGEISTAILTVGRIASACEAGRDAIPAFANVASYESYYRVDGGQGCDYECLRPVYNAMKKAGTMRPLISGETVTVLSEFVDPEDKNYRICRVRTKHGQWLVLCIALRGTD